MVNDQMVNKVRLFLTDVDGCLTDGGMYYSAEGEVLKRFCVYDGMGMVCLQQAGIPCGILTSENSLVVKARAEKLKLRFLYPSPSMRSATSETISTISTSSAPSDTLVARPTPAPKSKHSLELPEQKTTYKSSRPPEDKEPSVRSQTKY